MTDKDKSAGTMVRDALEMMPEEMTIQEVAAMILMIVDGYVGHDKAASISLLLSAFITYASTKGLDDSKISMMLRLSASALDAGDHVQAMH